MTKCQPLSLWTAALLCFAFAAQAQLAPPDGAPPTIAGGIAGVVAKSAAALTAGPGTADPTAASVPSSVLMPRLAVPTSAAPGSGLGNTDSPPITVVKPHPRQTRSLGLEVGSGQIVTLDGPAASVFAADPRVAEVRPASPTSLFVFGIAPGRTTIAAIDENGVAFAQYDVMVRPSNYAVGQAQSAIARSLPGRGVRVSAEANTLVISGTVPVAGDADLAMRIVHDFAGPGQTVDNRLSVLSGQQVNLRVRIAEVSRAVVRNLGVNWSALGNIGKIASFPALALNANAAIAPAALAAVQNPLFMGANFNAVIDALAQDNLAHVLAEPNLTAMSGETASFLVGGEFPIPIAQQNNQVTIEFKQYGVSLAFVPTVISGGRINMRVRPEVSALTTVGAVQLSVGNSTIQVPALTVRRADTTVELASGQTFAIAGLLQDDTTLANNGLPGLGELPILGALFRSDAFQRNQTELVIVVTPYLVTGVSSPGQLRLPTDNWKPPNDLERLLLLRQSAASPGQPVVAPHIPGDAGFVIR